MIAGIELDGDNVYTLSYELENEFNPEHISRQRLTNIEWNEEKQCWEVYRHHDQKLIKSGFPSKEKALEWEIQNCNVGSSIWNDGIGKIDHDQEIN